MDEQVPQDAVAKLVAMMFKDTIEKGARRMSWDAPSGDFVVVLELDDGPKEMMRPPAHFLEPMLAEVRLMAGGLPEPRPDSVEGGLIQLRLEGDPRTLSFSVALFPQGAPSRLRVICHGAREPTAPPRLEEFF